MANKPYWHEAVKLELCALCGKHMAATVIRFLPHMAAEVLSPPRFGERHFCSATAVAAS
jgi:hypothetical protein